MKRVWVIIKAYDSDCVSVVGTTTDPEVAEAYARFTPYVVEDSFLDEVQKPETSWRATWSGPIGSVDVSKTWCRKGDNEVHRDTADPYAPMYTVHVEAETFDEAKVKGLLLIADAIHRDEECGAIQNQMMARDEWLRRRKEQMKREEEDEE